ncbi:MAG: MFS transporter [Clostridia bacterium]|nr:MFS transporter [Clostridia bacterium]
MSAKKSIFESPILSTKIKSANAKFFPEAAIGYFIGPTLAILSSSILNNYLIQYFTDVLNVNTWGAWASTFLTLLPILSAILVVIGNIVVGRVMENNKTKAGKARPLLLVAIPLIILALLVLFVFTPYTTAESGLTKQIVSAILIALGYNLWYAVAYPFYYTSHSALVTLSTRNGKERSLLATIVNATQLAAIGLTTMILPFFLKYLFVEGDPNASYNAWKIFVIAIMAISAIGALLEYYFTRERITEESFNVAVAQPMKKATPISVQAKICLKDKFWIIMIVFFILYQLGGQLKNVSQLYFLSGMFKDPAGPAGGYSKAYGGTLSGTLSIIGAIPTALGMVIAWPLSRKIGKGKAILFGSIVAVLGGVLGLIFPDNYVMVCVSFVIKSLGSTPAMYLSLALLADIMDHQEAMHGIRTDGLSMAIYGAVMVALPSVATGIINGIISACGYGTVVNGVAQISNETLRAVLPWLFIGGETICYGLILIIFLFMGVEKFSNFDHKAIIADQKAKAEAEGVEYIDPVERMKAEEAEAEAKSEEARKAELKAACEKKGLNYEEEEAKYQAKKAEADAKAAAKKAEADAKAAAKKAEAEAKYNALSEEEKAAIKAKEEQKAKAEEERDAAILKEFNALREKNGKPAI